MTAANEGLAMRRRAVIVVVLITVAGIALWLFPRPPHGVTDPTALLPSDTVALLQWRDLAATTRRLHASPLGRYLTTINWQEQLDDQGADLATTIDHFLQGLEQVVTSPLLPELFGQDSALALLSPSAADRQLAASARLEKNLLLLTRPRTRAALLQSLAPLLAHDLEVSEEHSDGVTLRRYSRQGETLCHTAVVDGWLLLSRHPDTLLRCSRRPAADHSLSSRNDFQTGMPALGEGWNMRGHADIPRLWQDVLNNAAPLPLRHLSLASFRQPGHRRLLLRLERDIPEGTRTGPGSPWERPATDNRTLTRVPGELLAYAWCSWLSPALWEMWFTSSAGEAFTQLIDDRNRTPAVRTAPPWSRILGEQVALLVTDLPVSAVLPVPQMGFLVEVRDRRGLEQRLAPILRDVPVQRENIAGVEVQVFHLAGGLVQPAYALHDNFLLLADSRGQMEEILNHTQTSPLADQPDFRAVLPAGEKSGSLALFLRLNSLHASLQRLLPQVSAILALQEDPAARRWARRINTVIVPLLNTLTPYRAQGLRGHGENGFFTLETSLLIDE